MGREFGLGLDSSRRGSAVAAQVRRGRLETRSAAIPAGIARDRLSRFRTDRAVPSVKPALAEEQIGA